MKRLFFYRYNFEFLDKRPLLESSVSVEYKLFKNVSINLTASYQAGLSKMSEVEVNYHSTAPGTRNMGLEGLLFNTGESWNFSLGFNYLLKKTKLINYYNKNEKTFT